MDPFTVLGLRPRFAIAPADIDRRQRELFAQLRNCGSAALEQLNEAVRLVKDPASRAEQLLLLRGWPHRGSPEPELLERVFADRELIDAARRGGDTGALRRWLSGAVLRKQAVLDALSKAFDGDGRDDGSLVGVGMAPSTGKRGADGASAPFFDPNVVAAPSGVALDESAAPSGVALDENAPSGHHDDPNQKVRALLLLEELRFLIRAMSTAESALDMLDEATAQNLE